MPVCDARAKLWGLIRSTPRLDWLLLTKRIDKVADLVPWKDNWPENVWLGFSASTQDDLYEGLPHLLNIKSRIRFLSLEPLIGRIELTTPAIDPRDDYILTQPLTGWQISDPIDGDFDTGSTEHKIHWVIVGGESGSNARVCGVNWIRTIVNDCARHGVPCFVKQIGDAAFNTPYVVRAAKGGDPAEWPTDIRVQQFPTLKEKAS